MTVAFPAGEGERTVSVVIEASAPDQPAGLGGHRDGGITAVFAWRMTLEATEKLLAQTSQLAEN